MAKISKISNQEGYIIFDCPGCKCAHSIPVVIGAHQTGSWGWNGSMDKPTFTPSILYNVGRKNPTEHLCHSFVKDGMIQFLSDCTHELAGQTVELPEQ